MQLNRRMKSLTVATPGLLFGVVLSASIGAMCYFLTMRTIDRDNEERFQNMAYTAKNTIDARIRSYTNVVRAAASYFQATGTVSREEFHRFVTGLDLEKQYPAIDAFTYVHWLTDDKRDEFVARVRREDELAHNGAPPFKITPPGRRPEYSIVLYIEPNPGWQKPLGFDLDFDPVTRKAMAIARDTGIAANSGAPIKAMKAQNRIGFGMRLPVYRFGAALNTVQDKRAAYIGSVGIAFNVQQLVEGVLGELPAKDIRMTLFNRIISLDPSVQQPPQLIYDSRGGSTAGTPQLPDPADDGSFHADNSIEFNGRTWDAHFSVPKEKLHRSSDDSFPFLALLAGFVTTMLLYALFYTLSSSRLRAMDLAKGMTRELRDSQTKLLQSHRKLRELAAHMDDIKEEERKRIAREIHDDLGQNLLALRIDAELLLARTRDRHPRLHTRAKATLGHIDATIKSVRQIINDLRPNVLDLGLNAAASWQITQFRQRTSINCELIEYNTDITVSDQCATGLFRILQESLNNVWRHAKATSVRVELGIEDHWVIMSVRDNGVGISTGGVHKSGKFGLVGIEERIRILGGKFTITSEPGQGTTVHVSIPAYHTAVPAIKEEISAVYEFERAELNSLPSIS